MTDVDPQTAPVTDDPQLTIVAGSDNLDAVADELLARGLPIRLRLQPTIYRPEYAGNPANYVAWKGQTWSLEARSAAGVRAWRDAVDLLMRAIQLGRLAAAVTALRTVVVGEEGD